MELEDIETLNNSWQKEINHVKTLEERIRQLESAAKQILSSMEQYQFFLDGYKNGSASISEVIGAGDAQQLAYQRLWHLLFKK